MINGCPINLLRSVTPSSVICSSIAMSVCLFFMLEVLLNSFTNLKAAVGNKLLFCHFLQ